MLMGYAIYQWIRMVDLNKRLKDNTLQIEQNQIIIDEKTQEYQYVSSEYYRELQARKQGYSYPDEKVYFAK